jgi:hypothetical protein
VAKWFDMVVELLVYTTVNTSGVDAFPWLPGRRLNRDSERTGNRFFYPYGAA